MPKSHDQVKVGVFVLVGFTILLLLLFFISGVYLFRSGYHINVMYDYVSILDKGAPVRMAGVRVGEVSKVSLVHEAETGKNRVKVKLFIEKDIEIRENYVFKIQGTHILSEPHIEIDPEPGDAPLLIPGVVIEGISPVAIESLVDRAHTIAANLDEIFEVIKDSVGDEESKEALKNILVNLASLTKSLEMILSGNEENMRNVISNIERSSESLKGLIGNLERGDGTLYKLFKDDELYEELLGFATEIKENPWKLMKKK